MAYARVTRTRNGAGALAYAEGDGHGHNGNEARNDFVTPVNMVPGVPFAEQMKVYWDRASSRHEVQALRIVQSFSTSEFDPNNPSDVARANALGVEFASRFYPDRQAVVFTQTDGLGGKVHNHIIVSDVSMKDCKGTTPEQNYWVRVGQWTDEVTSEFTQLDKGRQDVPDKTTQAERAAREKGAYVWKDDLKGRIRACMGEATSEDDFMARMAEAGVAVDVHESKRNGRYYTYGMDVGTIAEGDADQIPPVQMKRARDAKGRLKARSTKLGTDYGPEALEEAMAQRAIERPVEPPKAPDDKLPAAEEKTSPEAPEEPRRAPVDSRSEQMRRWDSLPRDERPGGITTYAQMCAYHDGAMAAERKADEADRDHDGVEDVAEARPAPDAWETYKIGPKMVSWGLKTLRDGYVRESRQRMVDPNGMRAYESLKDAMGHQDGFCKYVNRRLDSARERMRSDKAGLARLMNTGGDSAVLASMFRQVAQTDKGDRDAATRWFGQLMALLLELQAQERDRQRREELERRVYEDRAEVWAAEMQLKAAGFARNAARDYMASSRAANASRRLPTVAYEEALEDDMQLG